MGSNLILILFNLFGSGNVKPCGIYRSKGHCHWWIPKFQKWGGVGGLPGQELQLFSGQVKKKIREGEGHTSMAPDPTSLRFSILQTM